MIHLNEVNLLERLTFAQKLISECNKISKKIFVQGCNTFWKKDGTPVTNLDIDLEQFISKKIILSYPMDGCIGEELVDKDSRNGYTWTVDPIDGTRSFIYKVPLFSTMIGLLFEDEPILGIISFPILNECIYAVKNLGAYWIPPFKKKSIKCKVKIQDIHKPLICCTDIKFFMGQYAGLLNLLQSRAKNIRTWGDSYGHMLVVTGRAALMIDPAPSLKIYDIVPIKIIAEEAGAIFRYLDIGSNVRSATGAVTTIASNLDKLVVNHLNQCNLTQK